MRKLKAQIECLLIGSFPLWLAIIGLLCTQSCKRSTGYFENGPRTENTKADITMHQVGISVYADDYAAAVALLELQQYAAALEIYRALLQKEDESQLPSVYINMASIYALQGARDTALANYLIAWRLDSTDVGSIEALSGGYYGVGNYLEAIRYSEQVAARAPERPDCHYILAGSYQQLGLASFALTHAKRYVDLVPNSTYRVHIDQIIASGGK